MESTENVTIEGYKDGDQWVVAVLDSEREEVFLNVYESKAAADKAARGLAKQFPMARWEVQL